MPNFELQQLDFGHCLNAQGFLNLAILAKRTETCVKSIAKIAKFTDRLVKMAIHTVPVCLVIFDRFTVRKFNETKSTVNLKKTENFSIWFIIFNFKNIDLFLQYYMHLKVPVVTAQIFLTQHPNTIIKISKLKKIPVCLERQCPNFNK